MTPLRGTYSELAIFASCAGVGKRCRDKNLRFSSSNRFARESGPNGRSDRGGAFRGDLTPMRFDEMAHNGEPESRSARGPRAAGVDAIEALEDPGQVFARDADAGVANTDHHRVVLRLSEDRDCSAHGVPR